MSDKVTKPSESGETDGNGDDAADAVEPSSDAVEPSSDASESSSDASESSSDASESSSGASEPCSDAGESSSDASESSSDASEPSSDASEPSSDASEQALAGADADDQAEAAEAAFFGGGGLETGDDHPQPRRGAQAQAAAAKAQAAADKALATQRGAPDDESGSRAEAPAAEDGPGPSGSGEASEDDASSVPSPVAVPTSTDGEPNPSKRKKGKKKKGAKNKPTARSKEKPEAKGPEATDDSTDSEERDTRADESTVVADDTDGVGPKTLEDADAARSDETGRQGRSDAARSRGTAGDFPTDVGPLRRAGQLLIRLLFLGAFPGAIFYGALFGLCVWLHRSVEYMGVEDTNTASRVLALFDDEIIEQQLGYFWKYLTVGAIVGLVGFAFWELWARVRAKPLTWWVHLLGTLGLTFAIHSWFMMRSAYHYPQLYSTQTQNSLFLDVLFSLGVDGFEPWFLNLMSIVFWCAIGAMALVVVYRWSVREVDSELRGRRILTAGAGLVVGAGIAFFAVRGETFTAPDGVRKRPNVLVIAVDSLRGDVVGDGSITPNIDRFALRGTRFTHAFSVMPRTFPAWATILTGQYPHTHGIRHMFPKPDVSDKIRGTLPEVLADVGYRTAVISDFAGDVFTRGDFGFQHLDAPEFTLRSNVRLGGLKLHVHLMPYLVDVMGGKGVPELAANERLGDPQWLTNKALDWVAEGTGDPAELDKPFFLTVFYSAGHFPFAAPAPFYRKYADPNYRGRSRFHKEAYGKPLEGPARAAEEKHLRHLFLGALAASDHAIGRLLQSLDEANVLDNTIVIITADHGENLYEHGLGVGHGDHLYGLAGVHVPLIVALPSSQAPESRRKVAPEAVRLVDIAPTVFAELGVKPQVKPEGVNLRPYIAKSSESLPSLPAFAETGLWFYPPETDRLEGKMIRFSTGFDAFRYQPDTWKIYLDPIYEETAIMAKHRMLLDGDRKLLYIPTRGGVRWEMYDTYADPGETLNLVDVEPERFASMKAKLMEWMLKDPQMVRVGDYVLPRGPLGPVAEHTAPP